MLNNSHSILACCPTININIAGDAMKYKGSMSGIYYMQPGFSNGQRYWISPEANAIWIRHTGNQWKIGPMEYLGKSTASLYVPIKDPSKECPHDNMQSNWKYGTGKGFKEDVDNSVMVQCVPLS